MKHPKGCMCTAKDCSAARKTAEAARSGATPFDRDDVEPTEKQLAESAAAAVEGVKGTMREAALSGPLGKGIVEALKLPAGFVLARATEKQLEAIDEHLGIKGDKFAESVLSQIVEDEGEEEEVEDDPDAGGEGDAEPLSDEKIDEMSEDDAKAELKKLRDKPNATAEALKATVTSLTGKIRERNRRQFLDKAFAALKFPDPHRVIAAALVENCSDPKAIMDRLRAYKEANIVQPTKRGAAGNPGATRESADGGGLVRLNTGVRQRAS